MPTPANPPPLDVDRAVETTTGDSATIPRHCDISELDKLRIERDFLPPYNHRGTVVVASAWLAFYVVAALMASVTHRSPLGAEATRSATPPTEMMTRRAAAH